MNPSTRIRLSILFFFQFFIWSTWAISMGTWMSKTMGFSPVQIGSAYGASAIAAMVSPFFVGMVADRFFAAQRVLGFLHILGGVLLYLTPKVAEGGSFGAFYTLMLLHVLCYMPTLALVNAVAFSQMKDSAQGFGGIRVFGTIGWIVAGYLIGHWELSALPQQFFVGAGVSVALGVYCLLFLPNVPPKGKGEKVTVRDILGLDSLQLLKDRSFAIFAIGSFLICIPLAFYYSGVGRFLNEVGVKEVEAKVIYGQISEIVFMLIFPIMFARLGVKKMLLLGMACWAARYVLFANGNAGPAYWMLVVGLILHGPCFDFFFVTGQVYVDQQAGEKIRSAAQGFIAFITYGAGMFVGSIIQGYVLEHYTVDGKINWAPTWIIPAVGAFGVLLLFAAFFTDPARRRVETEEVPLKPSPEGL
jgi:nucleoside transporter